MTLFTTPDCRIQENIITNTSIPTFENEITTSSPWFDALVFMYYNVHPIR
jgi:hypothetical protein